MIMNIQHIDIEKVAKAVEADVGQVLPGLRESLAQAQRGEFAAVHTPAQILARRAGRPAGSTKKETKQAVTVRYSPDVLAAFRATGEGWQARMNEALRDWLRTHPVVEPGK